MNACASALCMLLMAAVVLASRRRWAPTMLRPGGMFPILGTFPTPKRL